MYVCNWIDHGITRSELLEKCRLQYECITIVNEKMSLSSHASEMSAFCWIINFYVKSLFLNTNTLNSRNFSKTFTTGTGTCVWKPVLKGFKTFIALAQSFWTLCFVISWGVLSVYLIFIPLLGSSCAQLSSSGLYLSSTGLNRAQPGSTGLK